MDCPICFNIITNSSIGSCTHHFCTDCLIKWCEFGGNKCPTCKTVITMIRPDREFDAINSPETISISIGNYGKNISIDFSKNDCAGITLENNESLLQGRGPGVMITKVDERKKCYKNGLRKGDILLFINNIPCIDHKQTINIINECVISSTQMICSLFKKRI